MENQDKRFELTACYTCIENGGHSTLLRELKEMTTELKGEEISVKLGTTNCLGRCVYGRSINVGDVQGTTTGVTKFNDTSNERSNFSYGDDAVKDIADFIRGRK